MDSRDLIAVVVTDRYDPDVMADPLKIGERWYWLVQSRNPAWMPWWFQWRLVGVEPSDPDGGFRLLEYLPSHGTAAIADLPGRGVDRLAALKKRYPKDAIETPKLLPGQYYPRMWRNGWAACELNPSVPLPVEHDVARRGMAIAVRRLLSLLEGIFENVEPAPEHHDAYGPAMRHLLILACTEVEAAWVGALRANGHAVPKNSKGEPLWSTKQYVDLLEPMQLNQYKVRLPLFPAAWETVSPFADWDRNDPTKSLRWYSAYNAAKHDREEKRSLASLDAVVHAVAAAWILMIAEFGSEWPEIKATIEHRNSFELVAQPMWTAADLYFPADEEGFSAVPYWPEPPP